MVYSHTKRMWYILIYQKCDGWSIRSILAAFFIIYYPEIVDDGRIYIADPPLYWIDYPQREYVTSKRIYYDISEEIYNKRLQHVAPKDNGWVQVKDSTLFRDCVDFTKNLRLTDTFRMHKDVMFEIIKQTSKYLYTKNMGVNLTMDQFKHFIQDCEYKFTGSFHEIYAEKRNNYIAFAGVYDLKYMGLDFNYATYVKLIPLIRAAGNIRVWEKIYIKDKKTKEVLLNIAEDPMRVIETVTMYMPKIKDRMKGLGQTDKDILARTTLNPETRTLIQLDLNHDFASAMEIIKSLRGSSIDDLHKRKEMVRTFEVDADDIDT